MKRSGDQAGNVTGSGRASSSEGPLIQQQEQLLQTQQQHQHQTQVDAGNCVSLPMPGRFCCICGKFARVPFAKCNYCGDSPSYHHGRCCPWKPPEENACVDKGPIEEPEGLCQVCGFPSGLQLQNGFHCIPCHNQQQ